MNNFGNETHNEAPTRIVVIPARGGSKRIPRKNMRQILGRPIIEYPISAAISSKLFSMILISSDDDEILKHTSKIDGVSVSRRPDSLSGDEASVYSVLRYEKDRLNQEGFFYDEIWLLAATACLLEPIDLITMALTFDQNKSIQALLGVTEYQVPIQWAMAINSNSQLTSLDFTSFHRRSQDLDKFYHDSGCLAAYRSNVFDEFLDGVPEGGFHAFNLDPNKGLDIDHPADLILAEALMNIRINTSF